MLQQGGRNAVVETEVCFTMAPCPQSFSSLRVCCSSTSQQTQPVSLPPNCMVSHPSCSQNPSSQSNTSPNYVLSLFLANPSKHSHFHTLKPSTDSSPGDTDGYLCKGRSSEQTTVLLPKCAEVQLTQSSHRGPTMHLLGLIRTGAVHGIQRQERREGYISKHCLCRGHGFCSPQPHAPHLTRSLLNICRPVSHL